MVYLSDQILVLHHAQLSACGLGDPLPCHQVSYQHGGRTHVHWKHIRKHHQTHSETTLERVWRGGGARRLTRLLLPRLGQVGDAGVRAHEDVAGVQVSLQEVLLGFTDVDAAERRLWEGVGRDEGQAVQAHLVDAVDGLRRDSRTKQLHV